MIYTFKEVRTTGPTGTHLRFKQDQENSCTELGKINELHYVFIPDDIAEDLLANQHEECEVTLVNLTPEIKEQLKRNRYFQIQKQVTRTDINTEIGDVYDLIADCMKLIEMNIMLTSRLAADYFGTTALDEPTKDIYAQRNQAFLDSVDNGQLLIRGAIEDVTEMQARLMTRYSTINHIVKEKYIDELAKIGL